MSKGKENPVIILVVVLALAGYGLWVLKNPPDSSLTDYTYTPPANPSVNPVVERKVIIPNPNLPLSYGDALGVYKDTRIQLGGECQATPSSATYKNGTEIMIDNRAPVARTVKVGSVYNIRAYDFKIIKLSSPTPPVTLLVDCDNYQNVASILIQK